jgi:hypothetical protein
MPQAITAAIRLQIVQRHQQGESLRQIAQGERVSERTARRVWKHWVAHGEAGLHANYKRSGRWGRRFGDALYERAIKMKQDHTKWGAQIIRVQLDGAGNQNDGRLPAARTLQTWFRAAGLQPEYSLRLRQEFRGRGDKPHAAWEIDAKERIRLGDGSWSCVVSAIDEYTGAAITAQPFPPA